MLEGGRRLKELRKYPSLCRILSFILHNILAEIMTDCNYYCVTKGNAEDTTVVPGDSFNFEVKVLYHSQEPFPAGLEHRFSPASITSQHLFQEGKSFLQSVMSLSSSFVESSWSSQRPSDSHQKSRQLRQGHVLFLTPSTTRISTIICICMLPQLHFSLFHKSLKCVVFGFIRVLPCW